MIASLVEDCEGFFTVESFQLHFTVDCDTQHHVIEIVYQHWIHELDWVYCDCEIWIHSHSFVMV